jgi:hypothetical protein
MFDLIVYGTTIVVSRYINIVGLIFGDCCIKVVIYVYWNIFFSLE